MPWAGGERFAQRISRRTGGPAGELQRHGGRKGRRGVMVANSVGQRGAEAQTGGLPNLEWVELTHANLIFPFSRAYLRVALWAVATRLAMGNG